MYYYTFELVFDSGPGGNLCGVETIQIGPCKDESAAWESLRSTVDDLADSATLIRQDFTGV
jgi:hypothetical protein